MAKKSKLATAHILQNKRKRPGRHSKKHKGRKKSERGQGKPI
jgi:hypothetical protein|tara:strand:+ start:685 stop:810 length:126 start_codon:yes stop_codon:yes gene_type:complete